MASPCEAGGRVVASGGEERALSVVVMAFDEEENVGPVLRELTGWLRRYEPEAEVIFVDDGSRDGTAARAAEALDGVRHRLVRHERNRGMGAALKSGVREARGTWVTFLPADGQVPPEAVGALRAEQRRSGADLVLGVYGRRDDGLLRSVLSAGLRALVTLAYGSRLRIEGPYLFRRSLFDAERLVPDTFFLNFEFPLRARAAGLRLSEATVPCRLRRSGRSKVARPGRILRVAADLGALRVRMWRERWRLLRGG